jgi:hypothetical protein
VIDRLRRAANGIKVGSVSSSVVEGEDAVVMELDSASAGPAGGVRVAATADLRVSGERRGRLRSLFSGVAAVADVLLVAGGLTASGLVSEAELLADELDGLGLPIVAVLGAGDYAAGQEVPMRAALTSMGWRILEAGSTVLEVPGGVRLGIAGMVGFAGGFGLDYELWAAVREHRAADRDRSRAARFGRALAGLREQGAEFDVDVSVAVTHFSPILGTLAGERETVQGNLGNELIGRVIDAAGADVAVHGMAVNGARGGRTVRGIPVYNVTRPILGQPFTVLGIPVRSRAR